jgi:cytochrome c-type biogenesis protein CcmH/NrfG
MATRDWLAEGARFLAKDDLINAISAYRNAVRASTRDFRGHLGLAQALERNEARHAAWVSYRAARRFAGKVALVTGAARNDRTNDRAPQAGTRICLSAHRLHAPDSLCLCS